MNVLSWLRPVFLIFIPVAFLSCHKEKASTPVIELFSPASGNYTVGDSIHVKVHVYDEVSITGLTCSLINSDNAPVLPVQTLISGKNEISIDILYPIDNIEIQSGFYNLMVFATNGKSDSRKFAGVYVNELPRKLKRIYFVGSNNNTSFNIYSVDSNEAPLLRMNLPGDFAGAAISSRHEQLYVTGNFTGNFSAINTKNNSVAWSISNQAVGGAPYFTSISSDQDFTYIGYYDRKINGYNYLMVLLPVEQI
jgi:hypothetical protein